MVSPLVEWDGARQEAYQQFAWLLLILASIVITSAFQYIFSNLPQVSQIYWRGRFKEESVEQVTGNAGELRMWLAVGEVMCIWKMQKEIQWSSLF